MQNLLTPIDLFGSLVTPRRPGEPLGPYRDRVLAVMGVVAHRDPSADDWVAARERELAGHTGHPVRLVDGSRDPQLLDEAEARLLTWDRLAAHDGPFVWPRPAPSGARTLYNAALPRGSGVATADDLAPRRDRTTGRLWLAPGHVVVDGEVWYVAARPRRLAVPLPPNTTRTAVLPVRLVGDHPHRFEVVDDRTVRAVGPDGHRHEVTLDDGAFAFRDVDGGHAHPLRSVDVDGPIFLAAGPPDPELDHVGLSATVSGAGRRELIAGAGLDAPVAVPVTSFAGVDVATADGEHAATVDPHDYWEGAYHLPGVTHGHDVVGGVVQPGGPDGHTHTVVGPAAPAHRPLVPVVLSEGEPAGAHPYVGYLSYDRGFLVCENAHGLSGPGGGTLTVLFDAGHPSAAGGPDAGPAAGPAHVPVPDLPVRRGETVGLGPALPATRVWVESVAGAEPGGLAEVRVRSEDAHTGAVPLQYVEASVAGTAVRAACRTGPDGRGALLLPVPAGASGSVAVDLSVDGRPAGSEVVALP